MALKINTNIKNDADGYLLDANAVKVRDGVMLDDELADIAEDIAGKQDEISDLEDIREGAGLGATALQPGDRPPIALVEELPEVPVEGTIYMVVEPE